MKLSAIAIAHFASETLGRVTMPPPSFTLAFAKRKQGDFDLRNGFNAPPKTSRIAAVETKKRPPPRTKIPPSSGVFEGYFRGSIFKQDKVPSVTGQFTSPGNAVRGRKNEFLQGFREKTKDAERYEKSVCYAPISHFFRLPSLKSLSVLDSLRCLFTDPIPNINFFMKDEVIPV